MPGKRFTAGEIVNKLRQADVGLVSVYDWYGSPRITGMLRNEGWNVNHKRVERIWRQAGLKVPRKQPRRGRLWLNDGSCIRLQPERKDHVWAYDFVSARTHDGLPLRLLVVDAWKREWLGKVGVKTLYIEPGSHGRTATWKASTASCVTSF